MTKRIIATPSFRFLFSDSKTKRDSAAQTHGSRNRSADVLVPLHEARIQSVTNRHFIL